jgi:hypothetical protein
MLWLAETRKLREASRSHPTLRSWHVAMADGVTLGRDTRSLSHARRPATRLELSLLNLATSPPTLNLEASDIADLYARFTASKIRRSDVSDAFTKTTALFSGIEVKLADGDMSEAEYPNQHVHGRKPAEEGRVCSDDWAIVHHTDTNRALFAVVGHE